MLEKHAKGRVLGNLIGCDEADLQHLAPSSKEPGAEHIGLRWNNLSPLFLSAWKAGIFGLRGKAVGVSGRR